LRLKECSLTREFSSEESGRNTKEERIEILNFGIRGKKQKKFKSPYKIILLLERQNLVYICSKSGGEIVVCVQRKILVLTCT